MKSCGDCHMLPGCGWCDGGSGTGLGKCLQGGKDGPFPGSGKSTDSCSKPNWNFIDCPGNYLIVKDQHPIQGGGEEKYSYSLHVRGTGDKCQPNGSLASFVDLTFYLNKG